MELEDKEFIEENFAYLINTVRSIIKHIDSFNYRLSTMEYKVNTLEKIIESNIKNGKINET